MFRPVRATFCRLPLARVTREERQRLRTQLTDVRRQVDGIMAIRSGQGAAEITWHAMPERQKE